MSEQQFTEKDTRAPKGPMFPRLGGTRLVCALFGHVWAPEWWAREQFDRPTVCLRCRVLPPESSAKPSNF